MQRGADWLIRQQAADGSIDRDLGIGAYYKVPWALAVTGHTVEASRLLDWIRKRALGPDGDVTSYRGPAYETCYPYTHGWIAAGAWKIGYLDVARKTMDFLLTLQDPTTGGFFVDKDRLGKQEIWVSCMAGLAALICGRLPAARRVADYLALMLREQPNVEQRFFNVYVPGRGLVTEFAPTEAIEYVVEVGAHELQWDFLPVIALAFLGRLYLATGDAALLEIAAGYDKFARRIGQEDLARWFVSKAGWAGGVMYLATGQARYRQAALHAAEHYVAAQQPDGSWWSIPGGDTSAERVFQIDATAEVVSLMDEMLQALAV